VKQAHYWTIGEALLIDSRRPRHASALATAGAIVGAATIAIAGGTVVPEVGAPALALLLGAGLRPLLTVDAEARRVVQFASKRVLQAAIVLLGGTFGLGRVLEIGRSSAPVMLGTLTVALIAAAVLGRALRIAPRLTTLIGVGTSICGASAIGAVSGVVAASEAEIAYAISTIFVFNVVAVLIFPLIGHALSLSQHAFGVWAGTAVNDTSSVVAAATTFGHTAGSVAVVTKLARTTMIVPIVLALAVRQARTTAAPERAHVWRALPFFLVWFVAASALNTAGLVPGSAVHALSHTASILIAIALAAIGLSTSPQAIRRTGFRPLLLGAVLWLVVAVTGLALQGPL
jgi:uncharacterized integral membrane protein (TIGR00698 family)